MAEKHMSLVVNLKLPEWAMAEKRMSLVVNLKLPEWASYVTIDPHGEIVAWEAKPVRNKEYREWRYRGTTWLDRGRDDVPRFKVLGELNQFFAEWRELIWEVKDD